MHFVPEQISETVVSHSTILERENLESHLFHTPRWKAFWIFGFFSVFGMSQFSFQLHLLSFDHMHFVYSEVPHLYEANYKKDELSWFWFPDIPIEEELGHLFWWTAEYQITHNLN